MNELDINKEPCIPSGQATRMVGVSADALTTLANAGLLEPARSTSGRWLFRPLDITKARAHFAAKRPA